MKEIDYRIKQNTLFTESAKSKLNLNIFIIIAIYFLLWVMGLFVGRLAAKQVINILSAALTVDKSLTFAIKELITCGIQILIFFTWVCRIEKRPIKTMGFQALNPLKSYLKGFIVGFIAISAIAAALIFSGQVKIVSYNTDLAPLFFAAISLGWIIQSASEEIAIRGWLIPMLGNRSTPITAIVLTSIIFGTIHLFNPGATVLSFTNLVLSGAFFAEYAIYSNNIWGVCGLHFSWNLILGNVYGFPVSGFLPFGETFLTVKQVGSTFLTGGDFGPEGGFITTVILLIGIVALTLMLLKKES